MVAIPTAELRPGLVTAADVRDSVDQLLVPSGVTLTERHLRVLHMCAIPMVQIVGDGESQHPSALAVDPEVLKAAQESLRRRFRFCDMTHPAVRELHALAALDLASGRRL
jgi:hypothetical protein